VRKVRGRKKSLSEVPLSDLSPEKLITAIVTSTNALLAYIRVAFKHFYTEAFMHIYLAFVGPKLD